MNDSCLLCERPIPHAVYAEKHHLVPRAKRGKITVQVCIDCGNQIHQLFSNNELRDTYNTIDALKADPKVQKWVHWIQNRPFGVCHKSKKRK